MGSNIIVVGCGRVGSQLASLLSESGHNVSVVDKDEDAFAALGGSFNGSTIQGVGFDEEVLMRAGVEEADCVAAVTQYDNTNMMVVEVANRLFQVPHVIARLYNQDHERAYEQLGIDYVCGTSLVAEEVYAKITSGHGSHIDTFGDFELMRFSLETKANGMDSVRVSDLERDHDIRIVVFQRADGRASSIPTSESVLNHGDIVVAAVRQSLVSQFSQWIRD